MNRADLITALKEFLPYNEQEAKDREVILHHLMNEEDIFHRSNLNAHMTASAWVTNKTHDRILMIHHNLYNSWAWLGGHADGEEDLLKVAMKEVAEESGLTRIEPVTGDIFSVEVLTVNGHEKRGEYVPSHLHLNITYLFEADEEDLIRIKPDENSNIGWFSPEGAIKASTEPWFVARVYPKLNEKLQNLFSVNRIPDDVFSRMKGKSFADDCTLSRDELRYLNLLHRGFDGKIKKGELVVHESIAGEILSIIKTLYEADYPIEKMRLIDDYDADDLRSMGDNNSSAFCFRVIANTDILSYHGRGLAIDINPLYNPYITEIEFTPVNGEPYLDRTRDFPYKIDHSDLCYQLFTQHGYEWGGDWTHSKDYQHFQKDIAGE